MESLKEFAWWLTGHINSIHIAYCIFIRDFSLNLGSKIILEINTRIFDLLIKTVQSSKTDDWEFKAVLRHGSTHFVSEAMTAGVEADPTAAVSQCTALRFPAPFEPTV